MNIYALDRQDGGNVSSKRKKSNNKRSRRRYPKRTQRGWGTPLTPLTPAEIYKLKAEATEESIMKETNTIKLIQEFNMLRDTLTQNGIYNNWIQLVKLVIIILKTQSPQEKYLESEGGGKIRPSSRKGESGSESEEESDERRRKSKKRDKNRLLYKHYQTCRG